MAIHPLAHIDKTAEISDSAEIAAGAYIGKHCKIGANVVVGYNAVVECYTEIGDGTVLSPNAHVGGAPQDTSYKGEDTRLIIGKNCIIREFAPIHRATTKEDEWCTVIGDECDIMALSHVAHDCKLGKGIILVGGALLAGHVRVGDYAVIGANSGVHQFARIGTMAMLGAFSQLSLDMLPYCMCGREDGGNIEGLNVVGLRRRGVKPEVRSEIKKALKIFLNKSLLLKEAVAEIEKLEQYPEIQEILNFIGSTKRGIIRR
ncbi:MAG: acyl-ACP--UDP-N-acetylglucosamine O-acyltransferase [Deferribacterales bacterium]|nr:acyl-ACP--UDP-N-acetylglucosamine O-acyltransferase [Deferribacterales bacterium]